MLEILLYGRGGQGVVTAGELLVRAYVSENKYAQSIPFFGGERRGAPVFSYVRLSDEPIYLHRGIYDPQMTIIFEPTLLNLIKISSKTLLINNKNQEKITDETYYIDANKIAKDIGLVIAGWPVVNTIMVGAIAKITNLFSLEALKNAISSYFPKRYVDINCIAAEKGFNEVNKVE